VTWRALTARCTRLQARHLGTHALGGLLGGLVGGAFVIVVTSALKAMIDVISAQDAWLLVACPLVGLALTTLVLYGVGRSGDIRPSHPADRWRTFPPGVVRADLTSDVVSTAGHEENFPWRLAPLRLAAIVATVGSGAGMGTEAPAEHLGSALGAYVGDHGTRWRRFLRPAVIAGGAAGVAALMGIALIGTAYVLEIGRRNEARYSVERVIPALIGGCVGWAMNVGLDLDLIRLVVPKESPSYVGEALIAIVVIGALSGLLTSFAASAIHHAQKWSASPVVRLALGGLAAGAAAISLALIAEPIAGFGPGGGAILWAENTVALPTTLLVVAVLRAVFTTAAAAAGGCGGIFVPLLAIGDIAGRVFAPALGVGNDLAGAAGAAGGIAGGYRLPLTATAMVIGVGGPHAAMLTCLGVVAVAYVVGKANPFH